MNNIVELFKKEEKKRIPLVVSPGRSSYPTSDRINKIRVSLQKINMLMEALQQEEAKDNEDNS